MKEIVSSEDVEDMYSTHELSKILGIGVRPVGQIPKRFNIPHKKYKRLRYYLLEDFIPYKLKRRDMYYVQSLDANSPDIWYGINNKEEIKFNIRELFNI